MTIEYRYPHLYVNGEAIAIVRSIMLDGRYAFMSIELEDEGETKEGRKFGPRTVKR